MFFPYSSGFSGSASCKLLYRNSSFFSPAAAGSVGAAPRLKDTILFLHYDCVLKRQGYRRPVANAASGLWCLLICIKKIGAGAARGSRPLPDFTSEQSYLLCQPWRCRRLRQRVSVQYKHYMPELNLKNRGRKNYKCVCCQFRGCLVKSTLNHFQQL